jgi:agmatinase
MKCSTYWDTMNDSKTFAGIDEQYAGFDDAGILLQSIPYDGTSTWGKGADRGFEAFLEARNMELYDIETDSEVFRQGIHILPEIVKTPRQRRYTTPFCRKPGSCSNLKIPHLFRGRTLHQHRDHRSLQEIYPDLTVLQLDAHADLRDSYLGSPYNHACALHAASLTTNLVQVGIRSMDTSEKHF